MLAYYKYIKSLKYKTNEVRQLYSSIFKFLFSDFKHFYEAISEDITELDSCFAVGAYKATLILAGSILEVSVSQ